MAWNVSVSDSFVTVHKLDIDEIGSLLVVHSINISSDLTVLIYVTEASYRECDDFVVDFKDKCLCGKTYNEVFH